MSRHKHDLTGIEVMRRPTTTGVPWRELGFVLKYFLFFLISFFDHFVFLILFIFFLIMLHTSKYKYNVFSK